MKLSFDTGIIGLLLAASSGLHAQHAKMDAGLSDLFDSYMAGVPQFTLSSASEFRTTYASLYQTDQQGRILVDLYLDGTLGINQFTASLAAAGASITGVNPDFRYGAVSAFIPTSAIQTIAGISGLNVMKLATKPQANVGLVTSQGTKAFHSDTANANGFTGSGITVGVLSNSYNTSPTTFTTIRAANDIASNDLKAPKFVIDLAAAPANTDEGRAMMQIVHDVAPNADLCFATASAGESSFASNIRTLRTNPACGADVIVDDIAYFDEPFFSDGQVAQAVNDVSTSTLLPGKKIAYFSSAGNQQGGASGGGSINVPAAVFSANPTGLGNINLATALTCAGSPSTGSTKADVGGGWLDFGGGTYFATVNYNSASSVMILQWDDLFYSGAVTTDLNWYFFNSAGSCAFSFASNNFTSDNGVEVIGLSGGPSGSYRIMIGRTTPGTHQAIRVRMTNLSGWSGGPFAITSNPTTFGHSAAASANSVAAYRYSVPFNADPLTPFLEPFSSAGPVTIAFDSLGNRLPVPEMRKKPDIAAPDGGDTTFFMPGSDPDATGFPNFFGTSAAAPHAAGVAALLLQKAGGPASLTPPQVKSILQTTAPARSLPYGGPVQKAWNLYDGFGLIDAIPALNKIP